MIFMFSFLQRRHFCM